MSDHQVHLRYLQEALSEAKKSPPKPTNFRVGCVLVAYQAPSSPIVISTGYTLELSGNTHAEQCALSKFAASNSASETDLPQLLSPELNVTLYTTLEPCGKRLSGNTPCVQRIIATQQRSAKAGIRKVIFGAKEPGTFVKDSQSCQLLTEAGITWEYIPDFEQEILKVAMEGHESKAKEQAPAKEQPSKPAQERQQGTNVDDISPEERKRQEEQPRNPKKRMMEI